MSWSLVSLFFRFGCAVCVNDIDMKFTSHVSYSSSFCSIQGLYCVDREGNVVFEKKLSPTVVKEAEQLVADCNISICGYDGDDLYTTEQTDVVVSLSEFYGEPTVQLVLGKDGTSTIKLSEHENGLHKLLIMDEDTEMLNKVVRPKLEDLAQRHGVTVTQALPTMLELLPGGCSKAYGVQKLCEALSIDPKSELLALGDAENDAEMLEMASIGVAVGNACPRARSAADFIMTERNNEGGAGLAMELFGFDN
jgi:hydroxymethylpyrimidine pyrophosphatase-like HAD family hydrolase